MNQSIIGGILILIGCFSVIAVRRKWDFFLENYRAQALKDFLGPTWMKRFYVLLGFAFILAGFLIIFGVIGPGVEEANKVKIVQKEVTEEDLIKESELIREIYYGIKVLADKENQYLIRKALVVMSKKTPEFFRLVTNNVKEIRQSKGPFVMGPVKSVPGTDRVEFSNFVGRYGEYNVADFLVHEATHMIDQRQGVPYTKESEIKAREAEIAFFQALEDIEGHSFKEIIQFTENEINMIRNGRLYQELP